MMPSWCTRTKGSYSSSFDVGFFCSFGIEGNQVKHVNNLRFVFGDKSSNFHDPSSNNIGERVDVLVAEVGDRLEGEFRVMVVVVREVGVDHSSG